MTIEEFRQLEIGDILVCNMSSYYYIYDIKFTLSNIMRITTRVSNMFHYKREIDEVDLKYCDIHKISNDKEVCKECLLISTCIKKEHILSCLKDKKTVDFDNKSEQNINQ